MYHNVNNLNEYPFVKILIPFILGILFFSFISIKLPYSHLLFLFFLFIIIIYNNYINKNFKPSYIKYWGSLLFITFFLLSYNLCYYNYDNYNKLTKAKKYNFIHGRIYKKPIIKSSTIKLFVEINAIKINDKWEQTKDECIVFIPKPKEKYNINVNDEIFFSISNTYLENFDENKNLVNNILPGINNLEFLICKNYLIINKSKGFNYYLHNIQEFIKNNFEKHISNDKVKAIANAISIGYKDEMDYEIKQSYSNAGASHLLAVSGLHVGIIYLIFNHIFIFIKNKVVKTTLSVILLWGYAIITGMSPSVTRATLMFSLISIGKTMKSQPNIYNIIAASAFIILLFNPFTLFNIGFQLSYLAVIGIIYYHPKLKNIIYIKNKYLKKLWDLLCLTIAAQILTAPLSIYYFNQFPLYFILPGLILVPLTPLIIYGYFATVISFWNHKLSYYFAKITEFIVYWYNNFVAFIENLPYSVINDIYINFFQLTLFYLLIITVTSFLIKKNGKYLIYSLALFLFITTTFLINKIRLFENRKIIIYNIPNYSVINFIDGKSNVLFTENLKRYHSNIIKKKWLSYGLSKANVIDINFITKPHFLAPYILTNNPNIFYKKNFFAFYGKTLYILNKNNNRFLYRNIIKVNLLIVQNGFRSNLNYVLKYIIPDVIVFDSSCKQHIIQKNLAYLQKKNIKYHICKLNGDFILEV